jgi:ABC-type polysaccharide/polyol phosphate transport system ATPase subunit
MIRVIVDNLSKEFNIGYKQKESALSAVLKIFPRSLPKKILVALKDVSFNANSGEIVGLIGRNGSGKSTLLRIIAGIYQPTIGNAKTIGKTIYLTGLGQGMVPQLTMRENVFLMGSILGLGQKDIKEKFNEIVNVSGLNDFVDVKVSQFSSGMTTRLNFSLMINSLKYHNPDVILLDEVFGAGGDIDFQKKGIEKMEELIKGGASVIMASHDLGIIKKYCHKVILLEKGKAIFYGDPEEVIRKYLL